MRLMKCFSWSMIFKKKATNERRENLIIFDASFHGKKVNSGGQWSALRAIFHIIKSFVLKQCLRSTFRMRDSHMISAFILHDLYTVSWMNRSLAFFSDFHSVHQIKQASLVMLRTALHTGCISDSSLRDGKRGFIWRQAWTLFKWIDKLLRNLICLWQLETYIDNLNNSVFSPAFFQRQAGAAGMSHDVPSHRLTKSWVTHRLETLLILMIPSLDLGQMT